MSGVALSNFLSFSQYYFSYYSPSVKLPRRSDVGHGHGQVEGRGGRGGLRVLLVVGGGGRVGRGRRGRALLEVFFGFRYVGMSYEPSSSSLFPPFSSLFLRASFAPLYKPNLPSRPIRPLARRGRSASGPARRGAPSAPSPPAPLAAPSGRGGPRRPPLRPRRGRWRGTRPTLRRVA